MCHSARFCFCSPLLLDRFESVSNPSLKQLGNKNAQYVRERSTNLEICSACKVQSDVAARFLISRSIYDVYFWPLLSSRHFFYQLFILAHVCYWKRELEERRGPSIVLAWKVFFVNGEYKCDRPPFPQTSRFLILIDVILSFLTRNMDNIALQNKKWNRFRLHLVSYSRYLGIRSHTSVVSHIKTESAIRQKPVESFSVRV